MRHLHPASFWKAVEKEPFSSYILSVPSTEERKKIEKKLRAILQYKYKGASLRLFTEEEESAVWEALYSPSFLAEVEIVVWDSGRKITKDLLGRLLSYMRSPSLFCHLLLTTEGGRYVKELCNCEQVLALDLSEEKPWDKEKRLQQEVLAYVHSQHKTISPAALHHFFQGLDLAALDGELEKLLTYIGEKKDISISDIDKICAGSKILGDWQAVEELLWNGTPLSICRDDPSLLLAFLGQLRFLLQQARTALWYQKEGKTEAEIIQITAIRSSVWQKLRSRLRNRDLLFFEKALEKIYEVELLAKTGGISAAFLESLLCAYFKQWTVQYETVSSS